MPVVINEFEIVIDPQKAQPASPQGADTEPNIPTNVRPEDIVRIVRRQSARMERLRAD